ncbi:hypothetical protein D3C81_2180750 [compost metagenome]
MAPDQRPGLLQTLRIFQPGHPLINLLHDPVTNLALDQLIPGAVRIRQYTQADGLLRDGYLCYSSITFLPFPGHHQNHKKTN